jgi:hypothetical protein
MSTSLSPRAPICSVVGGETERQYAARFQAPDMQQEAPGIVNE